MTLTSFPLKILCLITLTLLILAGCNQPNTIDINHLKPLITFDHYHSNTEINTYLHAAAAQYPDLVSILQIGVSRGGEPIYALEINNPATGSALEKPAFYCDGNIHGGELLAGEGALYFIDMLLKGCDSNDPTIRNLIDTSALYIVPNVNPDGRRISLTGQNHRANIRPVDDDHDGSCDEDPPDDLDGDGLIVQMRYKSPQGQYLISPDDPRLMVRRPRNQTGGTYYQVLTEGIDNDGDTRFNEDSLGGIDLNRNFPANWHPAQRASGPFPLSEPESFALVEYITERPNIAAIHTFHTSGGMILRFPTLGDQDWEFPAADIADYNEIAITGVEITGYTNYADSKKAIVDRMSPGHGVFNDWGSKVYGVLAMTTEMWRNPAGRGLRQLQWNDQVLDGQGFIDWHEVEHPQLGTVEVGGWLGHLGNNPPEVLMEEELRKNALWVLSFAQRLPRVDILSTAVQSVPEVTDVYEVTAEIANVGWMPTATEHAAKVLGIAQPVTATINLVNAELTDGYNQNLNLGVLPGARKAGPIVQNVTWRIKKVNSTKPATAQIVVSSQKAGTKRIKLELN